jgi:predicted nuclease of restriction endonuclease-like RecB superfamily
MLTSDLAMSWRRGRATGPRSINTGDAEYLQIAGDLIAIFRNHEGRRRRELDEELEEYVGSGTDYRILRGLIKLLMDRCAFETATGIEPAEIRRALFLKARNHHPVNDETREQLINEVALEIGCDRETIIEGLHGDLVENQKLILFEETGASELLDRYNLAQAQALLYRSIEMTIRLEPQEAIHYRRLFDAIKYYRLIHTIHGTGAQGYEIKLSGPVSIFHRSQKYGIQMAVFLPALLRCRGWEMRAEIDFKERGTAFFELSSRQSKLRADDANDWAGDTLFVEKLASKWNDSSSEWKMERSREVVDLRGAVFIPDFVFHHESGKKVYLEVMGFWTPRYLNERLNEFERAGFKDFLLAASEEFRGSRDEPASLPPNLLLFKSSIDPREVKVALDRMLI